MKKGIVMEINDHSMTLLTPDGQFLQANRHGHSCSIGEEILFTPISQKQLFRRFLGMKQLAVAAAALFLILGSLIPVYESNKAYAYMSIDVNPSIELGINKQMEVVKLTAYNSDGKKIISHLGDWKKKNVTDLTQKILNAMRNEGYLINHHTMVISTVRTENPEEKTEQELNKDMGKIKELATENHLHVTVLNGTENEMEKAHQLGMTTGKYKESEIHSQNGMNSSQPTQSQFQYNEGKGNEQQKNGSESSINEGNSKKVAPEKNNVSANDAQTYSKQIPPGQLKKSEETSKVQSNQSSSETKNTNKNEKKSSQINKKKDSEEQNQKQDNKNKKD